MPEYNFDKVINRRNTGCLKYDALRERYGNPHLLPLWVADMDFETPDFILDAIRCKLDQPILGYSVVPDNFWISFIEWSLALHGWRIEREWVNFVPGVVKGIGLTINFFTMPGDKIIIQPPVYHIFKNVIEGNRRIAIENPLLPQTNGSYSMDLDALEELASASDCKMLILSNPHNPVGIVWDHATLSRLADICIRNKILVVSDEIHADMVFSPFRHIPFASLDDSARLNSITFCSPTKTFNMPGVVCAYSVVPNPELRESFYAWMDSNEFSEPTIFAPPAAVAAYTRGKEWRLNMLEYVQGNIKFLVNYCKDNIPDVRPVVPEASFLVWLDCSALGISHEKLVDLFQEKAGLALNDGEMFGMGGEGFMRINVATPRSILEKALTKLKSAITTD